MSSELNNKTRVGGMRADDSDHPLLVTPLKEIHPMVNGLRKEFKKGTTIPLEFRKEQLLALYDMVNDNASDLIDAVHFHMRRPKGEIESSEISFVLNEISTLINNLDDFASPKHVPSGPIFIADRGELHYTPRGCVCVISTWNFPLQLLLVPVAGAIAAGCTCIIRPSEITYKVHDLVTRLVAKYLDNRCYRVISGGVPQNIEMLKQKFDLIFYTGSCNVGKIVSRAAAEHLTPVVLELGGKNPVILDKTCDLATAARRLVWGRYGMNSGQVCLCPEYILCPKEMQNEIVDHLKVAINDFFGSDIASSPDYARIVSQNHFNRLSRVLEENKSNIVFGGTTDAKTRFIHPTILTNVNRKSPIMSDEVFGPIISIFPLSVKNQNEFAEKCISIVNAGEKPLAMYLFSQDKEMIQSVLKRTDSGGVTINDVLMHFAFHGFPFGGTGASGVGSYHGWYTFAAFCHERPVLDKYSGLEFLNDARYPPFTEKKTKQYRMLTESVPNSRKGWLKRMIAPASTALAVGGAAWFLQSKL